MPPHSNMFKLPEKLPSGGGGGRRKSGQGEEECSLLSHSCQIL